MSVSRAAPAGARAHDDERHVAVRELLCADTGYRNRCVHFPAATNLIESLARHAPAGADESDGTSHRRARGGALRAAHWNAFVEELGFGPEVQVPA